MANIQDPQNPIVPLTQEHEPTEHTTSAPQTSSTSAPAPNGSAANLKDSIVASAQSAMATINDHPTTQNVKDTISNGEVRPVGQNVKEQSAKTANEFSDLANARTVPDAPAATGQPLTHYHSLFYRLLSWKNPRATAISYVALVTLIFAARYLNVLRYTFKALYLVLGITATAEAAGKLVFGSGFASQVRPKKYFVIPKASLERFLDDFEQLINFFVIEAQRIVFAENLIVTGAAFVSALLSYWLIKFTPLWGLSLIGTTVIYFAPLVYIQNQEFIDTQLAQGRHIISQQATQLRDVAAQQTANASETFKSYAGEYTNKAQDLIGNARARATSPTASVKKEDFPSAPKEPIATTEPVASKPVVEPLIETS